MSYDETDAARDEFIEEIEREATKDFSKDRLVSFYRANPKLMRPAVLAIREGTWQQS